MLTPPHSVHSQRRAMPRLLDSEADEYFDFARFAEEQKEVQRKLADGWSMKGSSRYYSNIELMVYYDPKNPRLQHVYDDVDVYSEND